LTTQNFSILQFFERTPVQFWIGDFEFWIERILIQNLKSKI
jgi:hypothetical protein